MSTNTEMVSDALQLLKVLAEGETATAEQAAHGIRRMNQMMSGWEADDIRIGYFPQTDATATCPIPEWAETGVSGRLAMEVAGDYGQSLSPEALKTADDGYSLILRRVISLGMKGADMSHLGGNQVGFDIEKGW